MFFWARQVLAAMPRFSSSFSSIQPNRKLPAYLSLILLLAAWPAAAVPGPKSTTTTLAVTSSTGTVTSVAYGTTVTLTATVTPASGTITAGQVLFCDGGVTYCEDVHVIGMAQITSAGTATIKLHPLPGSYSYEAVFVGTTLFTGSKSGVSDLTVTGLFPTNTQISLAGQTGSFSLTATVHGSAKAGAAPTGTVSFVDSTASNTLGSASLGNATTSLLGNVSNLPAGTVLYPYTVAAGDFNGDGIQDLAIAEPAGLAILLGDGTGNFTAATGSPIAITGSYNPYMVLVRDFNGDGIPDILVGVGNYLEVYLGNGDGTFGLAPNSPFTSTYYSSYSGNGMTPLVAGDFNGDGIPDIAYFTTNGVGFYVLLGNGDGTFGTATAGGGAGLGGFASALVGDFNGDGIPDLVGQNQYGPVYLFPGNGDGTFQTGTKIASTSTGSVGPGYGVSMAAADFNGDGNLDLAIPNGTSVSVLLGNGNGTFQQGTSVPFVSPKNSAGDTSAVVRVAVGDFNGDGVPDLLLGGAPSFFGYTVGGPLNVELGNGDGTFASSTATLPTMPCCYNPVLGDFNGDRLTDVVTASEAYTSAQVLFANDTMATASNSNISATGAASDKVVAQYPGDTNFGASTSPGIELVYAPTFNPPGGSYSGAQQVQISSNTPNTTFYYTTDGTMPTTSRTQYSTAIPVNTSETIEAIAISQDGYESAVASATYTLPAPVPTISSLSPTSVNAAPVTYLLGVTGTGFTSASTVMWGSTALVTTYQGPTELEAEISATLLKTEGTAQITVVTPAPGGGTSNAETFTVTALVPTVSSISPTSITAGNATFTLTVNGYSFTGASTVMWGSTALATTYVSATQLTAQVTAAQLAAQGNFSVTVVTPSPGGGTSNANTFTVNALAPTISGIAPTSATAGAAAFPLTVTGTNFTNASTVMWGSTALTTTYVSPTELTVQVTAAMVATEGTASVTVVTPTPGGGTSNANTFTINALAPAISSIAPTSVAAGNGAFTLTVNGTGFTSQSVVMWESTALTTTYVSATELTAQVTAPLVATITNVSVTVETPAPGGGTSNAESFAINADPLAPTISGISPGVAVAGNAAFTLTVSGTNFAGTSKVMWGATALTTTYVSPTEVTAQVTAAEIAVAGEIPVTVVTPAPGGGTSNAYTFEIDTAGSTAPAFTTTTVTLTAGTAGTASYPVTLSSSATNVSVTCLNLPAGATCSYAGGALTITTTAATPAGTYSITAVFSETLPGAAAGLILLPFLLFPFAGTKKRKQAGMVVAALAGLVIAVALVGGGCGGGGGGSYIPPAPTTHSATSSGVVTLVVH